MSPNKESIFEDLLDYWKVFEVVKIGQYRLICYGFSMQMLAFGDLNGNLHHAQLITSARGAEVKI